MAIVPLDKMTLYGAETQKTRVLEQLQLLGCAHLINLGETGSDYAADDVSTDVRDALKYLSACPERFRPIRRIDQFHREVVVADALRLKGQQHRLSDEHDELQKAIKDLKPWGEFQLPSEARIGDVRFWFYIVPLHDLPKFEAAAAPSREVNRDHRNAYVVVLSRDEPQNVPGARVDLDSRPLSELHTRLEDVGESLAETQYQRVGLTRWCNLLRAGLGEADDATERDLAAQQMLDGDSVFAIQGWVPRDTASQIRSFAADHNLAVTIEPPGPNDEPPTLLHNPERLAGSEGLVTFYKTPVYRAWDPSIVSFVSFAIFFAMIVADAGYGIIFALLTACFWRKLGTTEGGRRGRNVFATIVVFTIAYGIMCGSYFGVSPPADSLPGHLKIIDAQSQSQMMPLTIIIGVIHLSLAHLVTAWLNRGRAIALASLGWVSVMAGATLVGMSILGGDVTEHRAEQLSQAGAILLVGGLVAVFLFSSQRPLLSFSIKTHVLRVFDGLQALTGLSGLFGDALSYLRLFALGLASAKLSETFNGLGASAWDNAGFGVIAGIGIVILGHTLNLILSIMGGVVHGLRLNCIEFYKWSLPEEGYSFKAFAKKAKSS
jgi:V/A-type H+-transporting ATPase subunit I